MHYSQGERGERERERQRDRVRGRERECVPGLAVGESMDRDSLLPPALSESLHIPPP